MSGPTDIKEAAVDYFRRFFKAVTWDRPRIPELGFKKLSDTEVHLLDRDVTNAEVWEAVHSCGSDKSPGPDGISMLFIQKAWNIVGEDFCSLVRNFFISGKFPLGANTSFITLIPKIQQAKHFSDFRPISISIKIGVDA